jgi:hypothetical protein
MTEGLDKLLKLSPRYLAGICFTASMILFAPVKLTDKLGVSEFADDYRFWIGVVFLLSSGLLIAAVVSRPANLISILVRDKLWRSKIQGYLKTLTEEEKQILRFYFLEETKTNYLRVSNGVAQGLVAHGIICQVATLGSAIDGHAFNITDAAWDYLHEHRNLLEGTTTTCKTDMLVAEPWGHIKAPTRE